MAFMHNRDQRLLPRVSIKMRDSIDPGMDDRVFNNQKLRQQRHNMLTLTIIQMFSALTGFATFFMRRNRVSIFINAFALGLAYLGYRGAARWYSTFSLIHCTMTVGIIGSFFIYQVISDLFRRKRNLDDSHINETWMLLLLSFPYLIDFWIGIYGWIFSVTLLEPENSQEREDLDSKYEHELEAFQRNINENEQCCICLDQRKNAAFYPWGHQCVCYDCGVQYINNRNQDRKLCILWRQRVDNIIQIYN